MVEHASLPEGSSIATTLLDTYDLGPPRQFFDEMYAPDGSVRPHYHDLAEHLPHCPRPSLRNAACAADAVFLSQGITFTIYSERDNIERIFPFDLVPRVIPQSEWRHIERGLEQRVIALNMFLHDVYHAQAHHQGRHCAR